MYDVRTHHSAYVSNVCVRARSGFARFTNTRYSMKKEDITNTFIHLTNVAIQKHAPGFDAAKVGGAPAAPEDIVHACAVVGRLVVLFGRACRMLRPLSCPRRGIHGV